jgi:hypothetical protein
MPPFIPVRGHRQSNAAFALTLLLDGIALHAADVPDDLRAGAVTACRDISG